MNLQYMTIWYSIRPVNTNMIMTMMDNATLPLSCITFVCKMPGNFNNQE